VITKPKLFIIYNLLEHIEFTSFSPRRLNALDLYYKRYASSEPPKTSIDCITTPAHPLKYQRFRPEKLTLSNTSPDLVQQTTDF
jgi:hypothetical protein